MTHMKKDRVSVDIIPDIRLLASLRRVPINHLIHNAQLVVLAAARDEVTKARKVFGRASK